MSMDDFLGLDFDFSDEIPSSSPDYVLYCDSPSTDGDTSRGIYTPEVVNYETHVKSGLVGKRTSKFMNKVPRSTKIKLIIPTPTHTGRRCLKPNMSRRTRDTMLYAFPSYDKCDSLLFFPTTLSKHLNSGDIPAVSKMFAAHFDKSCFIHMFVGKVHLDNLTADALVRAYECSNVLHPDKISCIHSTQVDGNQIRATGFMKFTKCRALYNAVSKEIKETPFTPSDRGTWEDVLKYKIEKEDPPPDEKAKLFALVDTGCDLLVFCRFEITITIDPVTHKITSWHVTGGTTSMQEAKHDAAMV